MVKSMVLQKSTSLTLKIRKFGLRGLISAALLVLRFNILSQI